MPLHPFQSSFNGGEMSPYVHGRFDLSKFRNGCRTMKNFIADFRGPAYRRGGMRYVASAKSHTTRARLVPFEFGVQQAYVLEFGNLYVRFFANGVPVTSGGSTVEVVTPYTEAQLRSLRFTQSADVLYIFHADHVPRKLQRLASDGSSWQLTTIAFLPPPTYEPDMDVSGGTITIGLAAITGNGVEVRSSADVFYDADVGRQIKRVAGLASITTYTDRKKVLVDVLGDFASSLIEPGPGTLQTDVAGTTVTTSLSHGLAVGDYIVVTSGAQSGAIRRVTAVDPVDLKVCTVDATFGAQQAAGTTWNKSTAIAAGEWFLLGSPNVDCTPSAKSPVNSIVTLTLTSNGWRTGASPNGDVGKYVRMFNGVAKITEVTSATVAKARLLVALDVDPLVAAAGGSWTCESEAWNATDGYPRAGCFFEQRLMAGGTARFPTSVWGSASADYETFGVGANDSDALEYKLSANQVNDLMWMLPTKVLLLGTAGSEFRITGGSDSPLTPGNVDAKNEDACGSADVSPVRVRYKILFVQRAGRKVLEVAYNFDLDTFLAQDLTELSDHLTAGGIVEMAYQQEPGSILWCVRSDGVLLGCTYNRQQEVTAWHWHETAGAVESICVIPDPVNLRDELWLLVRRTIDGATKRFIERLDPDRPNADSFVLYDGAATACVGGLSHLEGEAVDVVADGFVIPDEAVSGGGVLLPAEASEVVVGLHYESELVPNRPEFVSENVSTIGKAKQWTEVFLRLYETYGLSVNGDELPFRSGSDPLGTAIAPYTGDYKVSNLGIDDAADIIVVQDKPLPATILCLGGTLDVGD